MGGSRFIDEKERERVRAALARFKKIHGIGDPKLQLEILEELFGKNKSEYESFLSLSTLQRFLRGTHRTDDRVVLRYREFLDKGAPPPPYVVMGDAVIEFFSGGPIGQKRKMLNTLAAGSFAPEYRCYLSGTREYLREKGKEDVVEFPGFPVDDDPWNPPYEIPYSTLKVEPLAGTPYLKVEEEVINPFADPVITKVENMDITSAVLYEGMLALCTDPDLYLMSLRHARYHWPKFYILFDTDPHDLRPDSILLGSFVSVRSAPEHHNLAESLSVKLVPVLPEKRTKAAKGQSKKKG